MTFILKQAGLNEDLDVKNDNIRFCGCVLYPNKKTDTATESYNI